MPKCTSDQGRVVPHLCTRRSIKQTQSPEILYNLAALSSPVTPTRTTPQTVEAHHLKTFQPLIQKRRETKPKPQTLELQAAPKLTGRLSPRYPLPGRTPAAAAKNLQASGFIQGLKDDIGRGVPQPRRRKKIGITLQYSLPCAA